MKKIDRKIQKISGSLLITLPKTWIDQLKLKKGSKVEIGFKEDGTLVLAPKIQDRKKKTEAKIIYDKSFIRKFLKNYLSGTDFIKIVFEQNIPPKEKKKLYDFIQNHLINVQIIEDTPKKIVLQNFRIEGLSITTCFQRMNHIASSMFEDVLKNDKTGIKEKERNLTRFYYMAIRLIRQYLQEGQYTQDKEISLIRAMDYRLACEKIERIADELKMVSEKATDKKVNDFGNNIYKEYRISTSAFINENFETAIEMWGKFKKYKKESANIKKSLANKKPKEVDILERYVKILGYINDISNLVRGKSDKTEYLS